MSFEHKICEQCHNLTDCNWRNENNIENCSYIMAYEMEKQEPITAIKRENINDGYSRRLLVGIGIIIALPFRLIIFILREIIVTSWKYFRKK